MNWSAVICLIVAFAGGWGVNGWRLEGEYAREANERITAAVKARDAAIEDRDVLAKKLADNNDKHAKDLQNAKAETNRIRDSVSVGSIGLRVPTKCPAPTATETPASSEMDNGTGAELAATARQDYFALRDAIDLAGAQLAACQGELLLRADP